MAAKEEDGNDGFLGELRELAQLMEETISQDEVESNLSEKKGVSQGGENKLNSDETSNEEGSSSHQLAALSSTYDALVAYKKSDLANLETRNVPVSLGEAVPLSSEPSSSDPTNVEVKRVPSSDPDLASKYNLPDDEEVSNPIDYTSSEYGAVRYQLQENFSLFSIVNDASLKQYMSKIESSSSDHLEAEQPVNPAQAPPKPRLQRQNAMQRQRDTRELDPGYSASALNQPMPTRVSISTASSHGRRPSISMTKAFTTSTEFVPQTQRNQQAMNPHYSQWQMTNSLYTPPNQNEGYNMPPSAAAFQQQLGGSNMAHNGNTITSPYRRPEQNDSYNMPDDEDVTNPIDYTSSDYDVLRYQLSLLSVEKDDPKEFAHDASLKQYRSKIDSTFEAEQALYGTHKHASDFIFDVRQPVNPPPKPRLQRQNAMQRQRHTSELDPRHSASYLNQPMPTRTLTTATEFEPQTQRNQQAMNPHYSQWQFGSITNSVFSPPNQNESYNVPQSAAAFQQQLGGSNMEHIGNMITSPYLRPEQNDSYNLPPQSDASGSPYAYGSFNLFDTSSDNIATDSRFGYEGRVSRNHLSSTQQHQSEDSNVWRPSSRRSQRQQLQSDFFASLNQQNDRSDPSDQTQQRLWPRDY